MKPRTAAGGIVLSRASVTMTGACAHDVIDDGDMSDMGDMVDVHDGYEVRDVSDVSDVENVDNVVDNCP